MRIFNPMGIVLKNSDKLRALTLAGVSIIDDSTLAEANSRLLGMGQTKVKVRITNDFTASGLNAAAYSPSFSYPSFAEALTRIHRDDYLAKGDFSRFFHSFPLAAESIDFMCFEMEGATWQYIRCPFGFTACPYYASTWSAEFFRWLRAAGLNPAFLMDDWLERGTTLVEAKSRMLGAAGIQGIIEPTGLVMAPEKFEFGQQLVFLGLLIDTVSMTVSIEADQATGFLQQLDTYIESLTADGFLDLSVSRHLAGKLGWYCEVLQSGRMHINYIWELVERTERHGRAGVTEEVVRGVLSDLDWWRSILAEWSSTGKSGRETRIFTAEELRRDPDRVQIVQSDASGTDGFGYVFSGYNQVDYRFKSVQWDELPSHSHDAELRALEHYLVHHRADSSLVVWVSDSESAVWSLNKGNCHDLIARPILAHILELCDLSHVQIVGIWIPRELNVLPDHLSHLSFLLRRQSVEGYAHDLTTEEHHGSC